MRRLTALGLDGLRTLPPMQWLAPPSHITLAALSALQRKVDERVMSAVDPGTLATCLTYVERFGLAYPGLAMLMRRGGPHDAEAATYNANFFTLLREFIMEHGSIAPGQKGKQLLLASVDGYVGALKEAVTVLSHNQVVSKPQDVRHARQRKTWRMEQGPVGERQRSLGFRACHFRAAVEAGAPGKSEEDQFQWMVGVGLHNGVMRPGEPGAGGKKKPFDPKRGLVLASVVWWDQAQTNSDYLAVVLLLLPMKDKRGDYPRHPVPFRARSVDGVTDDPLCFYSLFTRYWRRRSAQVCRCATGPCTRAPFCEDCTTAPLFVWPDGRVWRTPDAIEAFRGWAGLIGLDATHECFIKGRCARIGGASDVRSYCVQKWGPNGGIDQGIKLLDERGRWFTDISWIYARAGPEAQLTLSALMGDMDGGDLEALVSGWTQPGRRWGRAGR